MAEVKYLVTVLEETGKIVKVQRVDVGNALIDLDLEDVVRPVTPETTVVPGAGGTVVVNIYTGGAAPRREDLFLGALNLPEYRNPAK
jgi:hypothetical protein